MPGRVSYDGMIARYRTTSIDPQTLADREELLDTIRYNQYRDLLSAYTDAAIRDAANQRLDAVIRSANAQQ
jgi:hypothetical protein